MLFRSRRANERPQKNNCNFPGPRRDAYHVPGPLPQARGLDGNAASGGASLAGTRWAERLRGRSSSFRAAEPGEGGPK